MLSFLKSKKEVPENTNKLGLFGKLKQGLQKTRHQLTNSIANIILRKKTIDASLVEDIETILLTADVGVKVTDQVIKGITEQVSRKQLNDVPALYNCLKQQLLDILSPCSKPLEVDNTKKPFVILMVGVNGTGKTTTIGKLAKRFQNEGKSVMLSAGDTFRAAAIEQLQIWGERNNIPVIAQKSGSDSASVIYDAMASATARNIDVLIADTAGRLHTQDNLMEELKKIARVIKKQDPSAPHETLLTVDAGTGQNALQQAIQFHEAINISGITLTKLDGTAKGGVIFAIAQALKLPIRFIGVGEQIDDLQEFNANEFINALFEGSDTDDTIQPSE